ncbi:hypothetical protein [Streptomyces sp. NPDC059176]|uniref:hypothetical protein n=1 Tax=unclassified Streptomyces TaxID=2593676 RepID=UPI0036AA1008
MAPKLRTHGVLAVAALVLVAPSGTAHAYDDLPATQNAGDHRTRDGTRSGAPAGRSDGPSDDRADGGEDGGGHDRGHEDGSGVVGGTFVGHRGGPRRYVGTAPSGIPSGPERPEADDPRLDALRRHDDRGRGGTSLDAYRDGARTWPWVWDGRESAAKPATKPTPSAPPSLAGRQAGEGRTRPGRTAAPPPSTPEQDPEHDLRRDGDPDLASDPASASGSATPDDDAGETDSALRPGTSPPAALSAVPSAQTAEGRGGARSVAAPLERQGPVLTLGAGCALMGLGLGYMGLRLRRR